MFESRNCVFAATLVALASTSVRAETPAWVNFPGKQWETISAEQAGLDVAKFKAWVKSQ